MDRAIAVMRMHLVDHLTLFVLPLGILASSFAINIVIWSMVPADGRTTGGAASLYVFVLIAGMFQVLRGLPFALGMGASRRAFALGTAMTGLVIAVAFGTLYLVLRELEIATGGWWLSGSFFDFAWFDRSAWPVMWLLFVVSIAATFALGAWISGIWARFGTPAMVVGGPAAILLLGGAAVLVTWREWWSEVGHWFAGLTPLTATGWLALLAVVLTAATWGTLRRVRATSS
jgi:hypothetical protein